MANIEADIAELERGRVRFERLVVICNGHFVSRPGKGSHLIFKTPWSGDPRINLQPSKNSGEAKAVSGSTGTGCPSEVAGYADLEKAAGGRGLGAANAGEPLAHVERLRS